MNSRLRDFPSTVATALEETAEGAGARADLKFFNSEVGVRPLIAVDAQIRHPLEKKTKLHPFLPDRESVREISLPIKWDPKVTYRLTPASDGGILDVRAPHEGFGTARLELSPNRVGGADLEELSFPTLPYRKLDKAWSRVIAVLDGSSDEEALSVIPKVQAIKQSANAQRDRYRQRAERLLSVAREALLGWIVVALGEAYPGSVPPREGYDSILRPYPALRETGQTNPDLHSVQISEQTEAVRNLTLQDFDNESIAEILEVPRGNRRNSAWRQRRSVAQYWGRYGLFAAEVSKLWEKTCQRAVNDPQLRAISEGLSMPEAINEATAHVLKVILSSLKELDREMLSSQAVAAASCTIEAIVLEKGEVPSLQDVSDAVGGLDKSRTIQIGNALIERQKKEDRLPRFENKEKFKEWAGLKVLGKSATTAYDALDATGCWEKRGQGKEGEGLKETIENTIRYAREHGRRQN